MRINIRRREYICSTVSAERIERRERAEQVEKLWDTVNEAAEAQDLELAQAAIKKLIEISERAR